MRILFLSSWFPNPPDNGSKIRVYHLLRALARTHEVSLVSFSFGTARPDQSEELHSLCADVMVVPIDPFAANRAGTLRTFLSAKPMASRTIPAMSQLTATVLGSEEFDAIIASTEMMAKYALQTPAGIPRILEEHNSMTRWMWARYAEQTKLLKRARCWASWQKSRRYEGRLLCQFDLITMVSELDCATTLAMVREKRVQVQVVPNGVDCRRNHPGLAQPQPNLLIYNGALTYSANYDAMQYFLAEIYPLVQAQVEDVSLTITGSTSGVALSDLGVDESVRLSGHVHDIRPLVAGAWACVVPIRQGGGTRLKILEAMALGTPVVSTSKGAEGLNVISNHDILIANEPRDFAAQVIRLLRAPALRTDLVANARRLVEQQYDWVQIGQRFTELIEATAAKRVSTGVRT